jgi:taurine dioxygenase
VLDHIVVVLPNQPLNPDALAAFCSRFGEVDDNRATPEKRCPGQPYVLEVANKAAGGDRPVLGARGGLADTWHTDYSFGDHPATLTFLLANKLPDTGGDTIFANMYLAYESLSPAYRATIESLSGVFDFKTGHEYRLASAEEQARMRQTKPVAAHRLVRTHPETGRKALFYSGRVRNFEGMTPEESQPILQFLMDHGARYEFLYRHRWALHDLVIWDQRCSMHIAVGDFDHRQVRSMLRCTLLGPKSGRVLSTA